MGPILDGIANGITFWVIVIILAVVFGLLFY